MLPRGYPDPNLLCPPVIFPQSPNVHYKKDDDSTRHDAHQPLEGGGKPLKLWHELPNNSVLIDTEESHCCIRLQAKRSREFSETSTYRRSYQDLRLHPFYSL